MLKSARGIGMMLTAEIDKALAVIGAQRELAQLLDDIKALGIIYESGEIA